MPWVTQEQIQRARETDLIGWLQHHEPQSLRREGRGYRLVDHDSLKISPDGKWYWFSRGFGGWGAVDFLMKVRGEPFVKAVEMLLGESALSSFPRGPPKASTPPPFRLPERAWLPLRAIQYLHSRGIHPEVISRCFDIGILYESKKYHNCVFVGRDESGKARFATQRGTVGNFKQDVAGSNKEYGFRYPPDAPGSRQVMIFESAIDALSHASLQEQEGWQWNGHRLALGGTSPRALTAFLQQHPEITRVILHLDSDRPGLLAARRIRELLRGNPLFRHLHVSVNPPRGGKDYNQLLLNRVKASENHIFERSNAR